MHRCCVGTPEYTPAELHGKDFSTVDRLVQHDAFGLACLIFQLLVGPGNHPFAAKYIGNGMQLGLIERIQHGIWAYAGMNRDYVPRTAAPLDLLHPLLQPLAWKCFFEGHTNPALRPLPAEWLGALAEVKRDVDFLQNVAPQLENDAYNKHWIALATGLAKNPLAPQSAQAGSQTTNTRQWWSGIRRWAGAGRSSSTHVAIRISARVTAAAVIAVAVAGLGVWAAFSRPGIGLRKPADEPIATPSYYDAIANDGTPPPQSDPRFVEPEFYRRLARQYRLSPKETSQ